MKIQKLYLILFIFITIGCFSTKAYCQASSADPTLTTTVTAPNTPSTGPGDYLGWAAGTGIPLEIKTEDNQPIYIHTFTGAAGLGNIRQAILGNYNGTGGLISCAVRTSVLTA